MPVARRDTRFALTACISMALFPGWATGGAAQPVETAGPATSVAAQDSTLDEYRRHLNALKPIVEACARARDGKSCDPGLVGSDDRVRLGKTGEQRLIRYDWLRVLLVRAQQKDQQNEKPDAAAQVIPGYANVRPPKPATTQLLKDAGTRLSQDLAQIDGPAAAPAAHPRERETLKTVLARREFRNIEEQSPRDTVLERIGNWINQFFDRIANFGARSRWIGRIVVWGFLGAVCVGLLWGLIQLERRWRIRLVPSQDGPAADAASARGWQLWLEDARKAAGEGRWREAVHFVYWAAISRLESRRLWPADRARTPREYLALVAEEDPRKAGLKSLTGSFERIWYGGRAAGESDYRAAEELAQGLIAGGGAG